MEAMLETPSILMEIFNIDRTDDFCLFRKSIFKRASRGQRNCGSGRRKSESKQSLFLVRKMLGASDGYFYPLGRMPEEMFFDVRVHCAVDRDLTTRTCTRCF